VSGVRNVRPGEAEQLVAAGGVAVLDVRTPEEYRRLGHIPGALLLPVDLIACAPATLPADSGSLLVCCEHGVRSAHASALLVRAGFPDVRNLAGGMAAWRGPREFTEGSPFTPLGPSSWLVANLDLLPRRGVALDVACGRGRHALLLAAAGLRVRAVDRDGERIAALRDVAGRLRLRLEAEVVDLEGGPAALGEAAYDLVLGINYLHRPLFPALVRAVRPGGLLLWETFTIAQAGRGHPTNPDFLLQPGELPRLVAPLEVLRSRDGEFDDRMAAGVVARRP
jgi:rhodanese-related sulfurtransferase